ncbi:MAG TPA: DUF4350 domain-containing protein [Kofleriaceae bacterium]|nr:DUF4350 domain-containing protein [Kofleriaceae bacterium]
MTNPFSRTTLFLVIGVAVVSLGAAVALTLIGDDLSEKRSAGADGYSVSAIGHQGLVRLLGKLDIPVVVSRSDSGDKARHGLLIVAEPTATDEASRDRLEKLVASAPNTLVVLPKWYGSVERGRTWIADAQLLPIEEVTPVVDALGLERTATIARRPAPVAWVADSGAGRPVIREPQLIATEGLSGIVADGAGNQLLGRVERDDKTLTVLADPDVLNNFGLRTAENARFAIRLIDELRHHGPVVIDETMHGYARQPSLVRTLFRFPLVLATLQVLVCAVLAVWAAMVRFGPRRAAPPPIAPGKDFLIRNTAQLLHYGGHHGHALTRYLQLSVTAVRHALHAPQLAPAAMTAWLERVRVARGGKTSEATSPVESISLVELEQAVETADSPARVIELADRVFRWRMEMTDGADSRS